MIIKLGKAPCIETSLQAGDRIHVSKNGDIAVLRLLEGKLTPLLFVDHPGVSGHYFAVRLVNKGEMGHEYAWWIARAVASITGLFVEDNYMLTKEGHHDFPVTTVAPVEPPNH